MKEQGLTVINKDKQDYSDDDVVLFNENWLNLEDFDLKIIITLLLNEKTICSYTTRDLCDYLGLSYHSKNINRIKRSLSSLEDDNNIIYNYCNHLYSIKIINKHIDTIGFKRSWLTTLKNYKDYSLIQVTILTGRKHQIRVQCASLKHPILNDSLYGGKRIDNTGLLLQSHHIQFNDIDVICPQEKRFIRK